MAEDVIQNPFDNRNLFLLMLLVALLLPHTFEISIQSVPDASFTRFSLITVLLTFFYEYGNTIVGPYSIMFLEPPTSEILLNVVSLVINTLVILSLWWLAKRRISRKTAFYLILIAVCVDVLLLVGFFSYQLDAWASVLAIPLPIFPIISILAILANKI